MAVRISAAIVAVVLAVLLVWTIVASFGGDRVIVPTGGVTDAGPQDELPAGPQAMQVFRERTNLQKWRGVAGPSPAAPGGQADPLGAALEPETDAPAGPSELVASWRAARDENWELLRDYGFVEGVVAYPDPPGRVLEQPQGRDWRRLHNEEITYGGGWVIFGFSLLLAAFLALRGRIPLKHGFSGRTVERFSAFERANHWVAAVSFLLIALTGLVLLYGQFFLKPWMGADAYSWLAQANAWTHMAFMVPFTIGVLIMIVLWLRQNLPSKVDWIWLKQGGGFFSDKGPSPPARRFNAGQKLIYWAVVLGGGLLILSGVSLMFPFFWLDIQGMQWAQTIHAALGLIMIAVIIGHIYIGTVGMVGAFDAMWSGKVDYNWMEEHHDLYLREIEGARDERTRAPRRGHGEPHAVPGE